MAREAWPFKKSYLAFEEHWASPSIENSTLQLHSGKFPADFDWMLSPGDLDFDAALK